MKWIGRIVFGVGLVVLIFRGSDWLARRTDPLPAIPNPNTYEQLVATSKSVTVPGASMADLSTNQVLQIAETNAPILAKVHEAVRSPGGVPLSTSPKWGAGHSEEVQKLKRLAGVLGIQSRAALLQRNTNAAGNWALEMILLGQAMARGGIIADGINALAVETVGTASLRGLIPHLDASFCRNAATELEKAETQREQPERILKTEKDWSNKSFGLISRGGDILVRKSNSEKKTRFITKYHETMKRTRRLSILLAAHAMELERGKPVTNTAELVPHVLKSIPLDPATQLPMTNAAPTEM